MALNLLKSLAAILGAAIVYLMIWISFSVEQFPSWLSIGTALLGGGLVLRFLLINIWKK
jgi:hypothetical protein